MSFGAGMGAGMGCGVGAGLAMGVSAGRRRACEEVREYVQTHGLTIHDATGNNVELDTLLANALTDTASASQRGRFLLAMLVLLGLATFGVLSYLALF
jgi:hypothetical protein